MDNFDFDVFKLEHFGKSWQDLEHYNIHNKCGKYRPIKCYKAWLLLSRTCKTAYNIYKIDKQVVLNYFFKFVPNTFAELECGVRDRCAEISGAYQKYGDRLYWFEQALEFEHSISVSDLFWKHKGLKPYNSCSRNTMDLPFRVSEIISNYNDKFNGNWDISPPNISNIHNLMFDIPTKKYSNNTIRRTQIYKNLPTKNKKNSMNSR